MTTASTGLPGTRGGDSEVSFFLGKYIPGVPRVERVEGGLVGVLELPDDEFCAGGMMYSYSYSSPTSCQVEFGPERQSFDAYLATLPDHRKIATRKRRHLSWYKSLLDPEGEATEELGTYVLLRTPRGTPMAHMFLLMTVSPSVFLNGKQRTGAATVDAIAVDFGVTVADYFVKARHRSAGLMAVLGHIGAVLGADVFEHLRSTLPEGSTLNSFVAGDDRSGLAHVPPGEYLFDQFFSQVYSSIPPKGHRRWRGIKITEVARFLE